MQKSSLFVIIYFYNFTIWITNKLSINKTVKLLKSVLTMLLYSSSSISFTFRQYDWKTWEVYVIQQTHPADLGLIMMSCVVCESRKLCLYQILELYVQVLADGELGVWYGLVEVCVQIMEHLKVKKRLVINTKCCNTIRVKKESGLINATRKIAQN